MSHNVQEFATTASNYREHTFEKHFAKKKRGRSVNRQEKRNGTIDSRIIRDKLAAQFANREFRKEMKQFEKTVQEASGRGIFDIPMPEFLVALKETAHLASNNLEAARITKAAMEKYPPL